MDYAKDVRSGKVVAAEDASQGSIYVCPRPGCGGRVYLPDVRVQKPHFRHHPGAGTPACDEYFPGGDSTESREDVHRAEVEDGLTELGLIAEHDDSSWRLLMRLPEITLEEFGAASFASLRSGFVEVFVGGSAYSRISALDLRPGTGGARTEIPPSLQPYRSKPSGTWPLGIDLQRWQQTARPVVAVGCLFRFRGGDWTRLRESSSVHPGEELIVICDSRSRPPSATLIQEAEPRLIGAIPWSLCRLRLPLEPTPDVDAWIRRLGHVLVPRPWGMRLMVPPAFTTDKGEVGFWRGQTAVVECEAASPGAQTMVSLFHGTNRHGLTLSTAANARAYVGISSETPGSVGLSLAHNTGTPLLSLTFDERPLHALQQILQRGHRLRLWIGEARFEAWDGPTTIVRPSLNRIDVRLDPGLEGVRFAVIVHVEGNRRVYLNLAQKDAESVVSSAISTASHLDIDAGNLGGLTVRITEGVVLRQPECPNRLAWWESSRAFLLSGEACASVATVPLPQRSSVLRTEAVDAVGLIRARLRGGRHRRKKDSR